MEYVYLIMRHWDNDEEHPEDRWTDKEPFRIYNSLNGVEHFLTNGITTHDILGDEYETFNIMECISDPMDPKYFDDNDKYIVTYHCEEKEEDEYYRETRTISFVVHRMPLS